MRKHIKIQKKTALYCILFIVLMVALDYVTKIIVMVNMEIGDSISVLSGVLNFTYIRNEGAAFGSMSNMRPLFMSLSTIMIFGLIAILIFWEEKSRLFYLSVSLIISGGIGNMIDRIFYKSVVDFIDFIALPNIWVWIFNVADSCVTIGVGILIFYFVKSEITHAGAVKTKENDQNNDEQ